MSIEPSLFRGCLPFAVGLALLLTAPHSRPASFVENADGFVFLEAENFDLNVTQDTGAWRFDATPLDFDAFSGWGYVTADSGGGTDPRLHPHLDYLVDFRHPGRHYVWVGGSDAGGKSLHLGIDGVVPPTAENVGGPDGIFGARFGGQVRWSGTNNTGSGFTSKAYLDVPVPGPHTVNLFIREPGLKVDWILLATNVDYEPGPYPNPDNLPPPSDAPASSLGVSLTQPVDGKFLAAGRAVTLSAKPSTADAPVRKVEFLARALPAGVDTILGEASAAPYSIEWSDPAPGRYALSARITDGASRTAIGPLVSVTVSNLPAYVTPLRWRTNDFETGLGGFTRESRNRSGGFDFGWQPVSLPDGGVGALGGLVVRAFGVVPYVGDPLERAVSLNEDLWFKGTLIFTNINANNDTFIGYFDAVSSSHPRVGLKVREPTSPAGAWRFSVEPNGVKLNATLPSETPGSFELHWIPSGLANGSGTLTGLVAGLEFSVDFGAATSTATFDTFGWLAPSQGNDDPTRASYQYLDNLVYLAPVAPRLSIEALSASEVLLGWELPDFILQCNTNGPSTSGWADSLTPVVERQGRYSTTHAVLGAQRWFRLRQAR